MAGLGYSLDFTTRGVRLSFGGYGDKMPDFIEKVAEAVATYTPTDPVEFERLRDVVRRDLSSYDTQQPYQHAMSNAAVASEDPRCDETGGSLVEELGRAGSRDALYRCTCHASSAVSSFDSSMSCHMQQTVIRSSVPINPGLFCFVVRTHVPRGQHFVRV